MDNPTGIYTAPGARLMDRSGARRLPIGDDGFESVAARSVFVDKSMLVADLLDGNDKVTLFCRPRRFGKSLAMTMLKSFFELSPDGASRATLFEGLSIWDAEGGRYRAEQGVRPVIFFTLNDVKKSTWEECYQALEGKVAAEYQRHGYLEASDALGEAERAQFERVRDKRGSRDDVESSLRQLALYLRKHHGRGVVILIDEYDAPIMTGHGRGYYRPVVDFMKGWLTGALKDGGAALDLACLTGVQRISKESIFSDLNNVVVKTALDTESDERFGFTEAEVAALAAYLGHPHKREEVKDWYDGYRFGEADIYNPWSVLNYFAKGCAPGIYWANTATNTPVGDAVRGLNSESLSDVYSLLQPGGTVRAPLDLSIVFPEGGIGGDELWSLLYLAGYLTTDDTRDPTDDLRLRPLRIPNHEVQLLFSREVVKRFRQVAGGARRLEKLHTALASGDAATVESELAYILVDNVAPVDLKGENSYHMLMVGLLFGMEGYADPVSNGRGGTGFYDVRLTPLAAQNPTITLELKAFGNELSAAKERSELEHAAAQELAQIDSKAYDHAATGRRLRYGIAFHRHSVAVAVETLE